MTDARAALAQFVVALERHLELALSQTDEGDPRVSDAYQQVADAFEAYEDALEDATGEVTPLDIYVGDEDDDYDEYDDDDDDDDDDDGVDDVEDIDEDDLA